MADLYLQMVITHSTGYFSQACMMSMEQKTPMDGNEKIAMIESVIEVYYKLFKEIHAINKRFNNVAWVVFQRCKNQRMDTSFAVNALKKSLLLL